MDTLQMLLKLQNGRKNLLNKKGEKMISSRERVIKALEFRSPDRPPRHLWCWPRVRMTQRKRVFKEFPLDMIMFPTDLAGSTIKVKKKYRKKIGNLQRISFFDEYTTFLKKGEYVDEWGTVWRHRQDGWGGEVKEPAIKDLRDVDDFSPPWDYLKSLNLNQVDKICAKTEKFTLSDFCANPFERLQHLRTAKNAFIDLAHKRKEIFKLVEKIHKYNLEHVKLWAETSVDAITFMDDWGAQNNLLVSPMLFKKIKPLYRDYCKIAHRHGKYVFFHCDGFIESILEDLIEVGIDAINLQLYIMNLSKMAEKKGKITFWGDQINPTILSLGSCGEVIKSTLQIRRILDDGSGGVIARTNWAPGVLPQNLKSFYKVWT